MGQRSRTNIVSLEASWTLLAWRAAPAARAAPEAPKHPAASGRAAPMPSPPRTAPPAAELDARALRALLLERPGLARHVQGAPPSRTARELLAGDQEPGRRRAAEGAAEA